MGIRDYWDYLVDKVSSVVSHPVESTAAKKDEAEETLARATSQKVAMHGLNDIDSCCVGCDCTRSRVLIALGNITTEEDLARQRAELKDYKF